MPAGYSNVTPMHWWLPPTCFTRRRGRFFTPVLPRTPAASWRAPSATPRRSTSSTRHSTPTSSAKRLPMPAGSAARCAG